MMNYSIIIPFRDKFDLLQKAVDSIPDREDIQIIIIYNGNGDFPTSIVPQKKSSTFTLLCSDPTKGAGHARNVGLKSVIGEYILFLDADDYFTPDAFTYFDKYISAQKDIVFFAPTSVYLKTGAIANRHLDHLRRLKLYLEKGNDELLRYRWEGPVCKMYKSGFIKSGAYEFEEVRVANDAWFSLMTGHNAKKIAAENSTVYVITEAENGESLIKKRSAENMFTRFKVMVRINQFLKKVGRYHLRIRLLGGIRIALTEFGVNEMWKYIKYAYNQKVGIL